jgi:hypothetical protein
MIYDIELYPGALMFVININNSSDRVLSPILIITNLFYKIRDFECPIGLIVYTWYKESMD